MRGKTISAYDVLINFTSLLTFMLDCGTDILVTVDLFQRGHIVWGSLTAGFVIGPLILIEIFSFKWHFTDGSLNSSTVLLHVFLLAPVQRYLRVIKLALRARQHKPQKFEDVDRVYREQNDVCILRLIESFLESAPQLVLQLYIILLHRDITWLTGLSVAGSLVSLGWALTAYTDGLRLAYRDLYRRNFLALIVHFLWQVSVTAARVFAFVIFATVFKAWVFVAAGIHWLVMTFWIAIKGTDFGDGQCEKHLFQMVSGLIYIFCFLNLREGHTRYRLLTYYTVILLENSIFVTLWFVYKNTETPLLDYVVPSIIFGGFFFGLMCLVIYYRFLHPSGSISLNIHVCNFEKPKSLEVLNNQAELKVLKTSVFDFTNASNFSGSGNLTNVFELSADFKSPTLPSSQRSSLVMYSKEALEEAWEAGLSTRHSSGSSESSLEFLEAGNNENVSWRKQGISKSFGNLGNNNMQNFLKFSSSYSDFHCNQTDCLDEKREGRRDVFSRQHKSAWNEAFPGQVLRSNSQNRDSVRRKVILSPDGRIGFQCTPDTFSRSPKPVSLSPLDASRLWAESKMRTESHYSMHQQNGTQFSQVETKTVSVNVDSVSPMEMLLNYDTSLLNHLESGTDSRRQSSNSETDINYLRFNASQTQRNEGFGKVANSKSPIPDLLHVPLEQSASYIYSDQDSRVDVPWLESRGSSFSLTDFLEKSYSNSLKNKTYEEIWDSTPNQNERNLEHQAMVPNKTEVSSPLQQTNASFQGYSQSFRLTPSSRSSENNHPSPFVHQVTIHNSPLMSPGEMANCPKPEKSPSSRECTFVHQSHSNSVQLPKKKLPLQRSLTAGNLNLMSTADCFSSTSDRLLDPSQRIPDTPWRLDYLNIEPLQVVLHNANKAYAESIRQQLSGVCLEKSAMRLPLTPLKLKEMMDSPIKFGRNVDLYHSSDQQIQFSNKKPSRSGATNQKEDGRKTGFMSEHLQLPRLCNSPYRFRRHEYGEGTDMGQNDLVEVEKNKIHKEENTTSTHDSSYPHQNKTCNKDVHHGSLPELKKEKSDFTPKKGNQSFDDEIVYACSVRQQSNTIMSKHRKPESGKILRQHGRRRRKSAERENIDHSSNSLENKSFPESLKYKCISEENSENIDYRNSSYEVRSRDIYYHRRQTKHSSEDVNCSHSRLPFQPIENGQRCFNTNTTH